MHNTMCFEYEVPQKWRIKNKNVIREEDMEEVNPELEKIEEQPMITSANQYIGIHKEFKKEFQRICIHTQTNYFFYFLSNNVSS